MGKRRKYLYSAGISAGIDLALAWVEEDWEFRPPGNLLHGQSHGKGLHFVPRISGGDL